MKLSRAVLSGVILWALIFAEWSIIVFTPGLKDLGDWQWLIHFVVLIPIVLIGTSFYYKSKDKTNGFLVGLVMLITGIILDAIITVPLFIAPDGGTYAEFFLNPLMLLGFVELLLIAWLYWRKKV